MGLLPTRIDEDAHLFVGQVVNLRADWQSAQSCAGKATRAQDAILPHERNLGIVFNRAVAVANPQNG
jgi:hypothetical protein